MSTDPGFPSTFDRDSSRSRGGTPQFTKFVLVLFVALPLGGCGYPEVSPKTYEIAKALYGICNRQLAEKLPMAEQLVAEALEADEISSREADWLRDIIETARAGNWDEAEREARALMNDQVRRGENLGPPHRHDHDDTRVGLALRRSSA